MECVQAAQPGEKPGAWVDGAQYNMYFVSGYPSSFPQKYLQKQT